jgi:hypothetical protein
MLERIALVHNVNVAKWSADVYADDAEDVYDDAEDVYRS